MLKKILPKNILSRRFYNITSLVTVTLFSLIILLSFFLEWIPPSSPLLLKIFLLAAAPVDLIFLYLTSYKKIFPQRIGDCLQALLGISLICFGNFLIGEGAIISGPLFIAIVFLIPLYVFLLDYFLPLFIGVVASLLAIIEYFLFRGPILPFFSFLEFVFKISASLLVAVVCSYLIIKIISEQKLRKELQGFTETLEQKVKERTREIEKRKEDLERFYSLTVGRELKMIELKEKIKELEEEPKK